MTRPGGIVAARDADYAAFTWYPADPLLDRWLALYQAAARANGGEPDAGRRLLAWAHAAGCERVAATSTTWCYADPESRAGWGGMWAERLVGSALTDQLLGAGSPRVPSSRRSPRPGSPGRPPRRLVHGAPRRDRRPGLRQGSAVAYLGVVTTALAYLLFYAGMRTTAGSVAAVLTLLEPLVAAVLAVVVLGERLTPSTVAGGLLLLAAVVVSYRRET